MTDRARPQRLEAMLAATVAAAPDAVAVRDPRGTWTFAALAALTERTARGLAGLGVGPRDRVAVLARNRVETVALYFACARLGAVLVPISWRLKAGEVDWILARAAARVVVAEPRFTSGLTTSALRVAVPEADEASPGGWRALASLDLGAGLLPAANGDDTAPAVQMYTSGTTGRPKGAVLSHGNVTVMTAAWLRDMPLDGPRSRFLQVTPLFHVGGMLMAMSTIAAGAALHLLPEFDPVDALDTLQRERITHTLMVPAMVQWALSEHRHTPRSYTALRLLAYGAAPMPLATLLEAREVFGCDFLQGYGLTETAGVITTLTPEDHRWPAATPPPPRLTSAGRAVACSEVKVVGDDGRELPRGRAGAPVDATTVGEIVARGANVMRAYADDPAATAEAFDDGWFRTGDLGWVDEEGYVTIVDRKKDMILVGGENVYPREVEVRLLEHPGVRDVAVIGVPHATWGEEVLALVVAAEPAPAPRALIRHCREHLARFKCPTRVEFVANLPRNAAGKLAKPALRAPYWKDHERKV